MTLLEALDSFDPHPNSTIAKLSRASGVSQSAEFLRIRDLPRRQPRTDLVEPLTQHLKTPEGQQTLRLKQAQGLTELYDYGGLFGMLQVGEGKSLLGFLAARLMENHQHRPCERPLLLVPASLKRKTEELDLPFYRLHWKMPTKLTIISYETLQSAKNAELLFQLLPDLIILDECQALRNPKAARTRRVHRYISRTREIGHRVSVAAMSGTVTKNSIKDYAHILAWCHPEGCPVPLHYPRVVEWSNAIDARVPEQNRVEPGALSQFCAQGENIRQGFRRRLVETPGVLASEGSPFGGGEEPGIEIHEVPFGVPPIEIREAFDNLRESMETPGGDEISDQLSLWRHASSLAQGFYLRWLWANGEMDDHDIEWLMKRKAWKKFVRDTLKYNRRDLDSEKQVALACEQGHYDAQLYREWVEIRDVRYGRPGPPTEAVWISDWYLNKVKHFIAGKRDKFLLWTRHPDVGERLAEMLDVPYFGAGSEGVEDCTDTCVLSIQSHGTGRNLQHFNHNFFVAPPLGGNRFEQTMGRTHRPGQTADTVYYYMSLHCRELYLGFQQAIDDSRYAYETTGTDQKLIKATIDYLHSPFELSEMSKNGDPLWKGLDILS